MKRIFIMFTAALVLTCCDATDIIPDEYEPDKEQGTQDPKPQPEPEPEPAPEGIKAFTAADTGDPGTAYVWDESVIPEITIHMTKDEWNRLLKRYDEFSHNVDYFHADFTYKKGDETIFIEDGGVRLGGNTSRRTESQFRVTGLAPLPFRHQLPQVPQRLRPHHQRHQKGKSQMVQGRPLLCEGTLLLRPFPPLRNMDKCIFDILPLMA